MIQAYGQQVKTYHFTRDSGLDLRALLTTARARGVPVAMEREAASGMVTQHIGRVTALGPDRTRLTAVDGGEVWCALWQIDRCALIADESEAC